jgi:S1-C subfamily serine protease
MFRKMQGAGRRAAVSLPQLFRNSNAADWSIRLPLWRAAPNYCIRCCIVPTGLGSGLIAKALRLLAAAFALALTTTAAAQPAQSGVDQAERATVRVVVILDSPDGRMLYGSGSGFVIAPNLVVTDAHVVSAAKERPEYGVAIVPPEGDGLLPAHIIRFSPMNELALLEFSGGPTMPPLSISTVELHPGDDVIALGYPDVDYQGATGADLLRPALASRTSGQIAALRADHSPNGLPIPTINHTAVISSGSSGGPLLDDCGRLIGINSWHVSGADTRETRGVATRMTQLLQFLDEAGVSPNVSDERCLSQAERIDADRAATINALQTQNHDLAGKLELADRLTKLAVVILIGGTLALFVAVCVLGAVLLSRRRSRTVERVTMDVEASPPEPFEPHRRRMGVLAIVAGAAVAAVLIVGAGVLLLRMRQPAEATSAFTGPLSCTLDHDASKGAIGAADVSFTVSGNMCINDRTLYAPTRDGHRYERAILSPETHALDILTIDPHSGEFRRERYPLSDDAFNAARNAASGPDSALSCDEPDARTAVQTRNETLMRFATGQPSQRFVWKCEKR